MTNFICTEENAPKFLDWIRNRGGLLIWDSANLSNPGASWTTPYKDTNGMIYTKPTWEAKREPARHIIDTDKVMVQKHKEVKRIPIALRRGDGLSIELTTHSSRKVRMAVDKVGEGATYSFEDREAVIWSPDSNPIMLTEWAKEHGL